MLVRKCDRCGAIIDTDKSFFESMGDTITEALNNACGCLKEILGRKNGGNIDLYKVRGDVSSRIDLCDNCRISFRKWYEGEQLDDIQEQDEQTWPEEDTSEEE